MKKTISTILALVMLATPLVGTACFANEPAYNAGAYVQNQDRSERFKFDKKTVVKAGKIASCIAAGTAAVVGATVAGLKIFEDDLPESIKELMPKWLRTTAKVSENRDNLVVDSAEPAKVDENRDNSVVDDTKPTEVGENRDDPVVDSAEPAKVDENRDNPVVDSAEPAKVDENRDNPVDDNAKSAKVNENRYDPVNDDTKPTEVSENSNNSVVNNDTKLVEDKLVDFYAFYSEQGLLQAIRPLLRSEWVFMTLEGVGSFIFTIYLYYQIYYGGK